VSAPRQLRVRVAKAAICRTDLFAALGTIPVADGRILGHEFTGTVDSMGSAVSRFRVGDRVVVNPLLSCGRCHDCAACHPHLCAEAGFMGLDVDGAFAQFVVVDEALVYPLPDRVDDASGAYAEPLAATMAVLDVDVPKGGTITVTGKGRIADLTRLILEDHGRKVERGCDGEFDVVVETDLCTANAERTLRLVKPGGLLVVKSRMPAPVSFPPLLLVRRRIRVQCVHYAPFEAAMGYLDGHAPRFQSLIGGEWPLEDHGQAFAAAAADEALKIYFNPQL
jgi:threonine dehydrogenase-like Zn-dependent dehydrogenase